MKTNPPTAIICFGDSITASFGFPDHVRWPSQLHASLGKSHPGQYEIYNRGIGGNTTTDGIARFTDHIVPLLPGIVLIEFGFNDASIPGPSFLHRCEPVIFKKQLAEIIRMVRDLKGHPVLIVNHPIHRRADGFNGKPYIENYAEYPKIIREVARETETPSIDLERSMTEAGVPLDDLLAEDGLHLRREGNAIYADHVLRGLLPILNQIP